MVDSTEGAKPQVVKIPPASFEEIVAKEAAMDVKDAYRIGGKEHGKPGLKPEGYPENAAKKVASRLDTVRAVLSSSAPVSPNRLSVVGKK